MFLPLAVYTAALSLIQTAICARSIPLDLAPFYNNKAFGTYPGEANFDSLHQSYPTPNFNTTHYTSTETGITYSFPGYTGPRNPDNTICNNQHIPMPIPMHPNTFYFSASFLVSADLELSSVSANVTFFYSDGSTSTYELRSLNFFNFLTINRGEIIFPSRFTANGTNWNTTHIFERTVALDVGSGKTLSKIVLPETTNATEGRLHVFAVSLWEAEGKGGGKVTVQAVRPTQKWVENGTQVVEVTVNNAGVECVSGYGLTLSLQGEGFETVLPGRVKRLCPGDQKVVKVGVVGDSNGSVVSIDVVIEDGVGEREIVPFGNIGQIGLVDWTEDLDVLARHESPDWFDAAKFGIMIHWGPYSVTGWGNSSPYESYAEWFWWYSTHHPQGDASDFYDYRRETYGEEWAYDDAFPDFKASNFNPKEWVDLFDDAGAKYFVITTKHHDGFALFDAGKSSNRSAVHYGPRRDLLGELFEAAETYQPSLKRGTYFSLPEWYNPDFGRYGFDQLPIASTVSWPGILAKNPYTGEEEPYTGHIPVDDFIADLMVPQMETLAYDYGTDIMWCDCGAANNTATFAATWFQTARLQNRQVAINSRCGLAQTADFDTPEYQTFSSAQARKWESNQGMDPYSYGYNRATPDSTYMDASTIVYTLVDMVSKNGNLLLDIGPRADGSLVEREASSLREAGSWIRGHAEAVFETAYWFVMSEIKGGTPVRFTQTEDAFYILFLEKPVVEGDGTVVITAPVPILEGDKVSLLAVE